mmetsp:Transcript_4946/g.8677  ORF Transcript_4946/g.8677 Transcript_4946/m.8677 type:complete len:549 (-) Transcript_4946:23-1669(-)
MPPPPGGAGGGGTDSHGTTSSAAASGTSEQPPPTAAPLAEEAETAIDKLKRDYDWMTEKRKEEEKTFRTALNHKNKALDAARNALIPALIAAAKLEDEKERGQVTSTECRLGRWDPVKNSWQGGWVSEDISQVKERIKEDRKAIDSLRRQLTSNKKKASSSSTADNEAGGSGDEAEVDVWETREICTLRSSILTREENAIKDREARLQAERSLHLKQMQRLEAALRSNFREYPLLNKKYQLLNLIGKGGFSEVYRAFDVEACRPCAVKIHELAKDMSDDQKRHYIKHAVRETEIQKALHHHRVVKLWDCFAINPTAMATVLEFCHGITLDEFMKKNGPMQEKEGRGIVIQVLTGLKYLNNHSINGQKIIHYDLKPGNLFYDFGEIKIADFGLSKVVRENVGETIELTSHGAGTYWYLPPECLQPITQGEAPKISNKVDVWSTGVIFFEMLFARRPFGHRQTQEQLLHSAQTSEPFDVDFPVTPKVSNDVKDFIRRLLTKNRDQRPDVLAAYSDQYLRRSCGRLSTGGMPTPPTCPIPSPPGAADVDPI